MSQYLPRCAVVKDQSIWLDIMTSLHHLYTNSLAIKNRASLFLIMGLRLSHWIMPESQLPMYFLLLLNFEIHL